MDLNPCSISVNSVAGPRATRELDKSCRPHTSVGSRLITTAPPVLMGRPSLRLLPLLRERCLHVSSPILQQRNARAASSPSAACHLFRELRAIPSTDRTTLTSTRN